MGGDLHPAAIWLLQAGGVATALLAIIGLAVRLAPVGRWLGSHIAGALVEPLSERVVSLAEAQVTAIAEDHINVVSDARIAAIADDVEARLSGTLGQVLAQVEPNGGSSMRDDVSFIKKAIGDHVAVSEADRRRLWLALRGFDPAIEVPPWHRLEDDS